MKHGIGEAERLRELLGGRGERRWRRRNVETRELPQKKEKRKSSDMQGVGKWAEYR